MGKIVPDMVRGQRNYGYFWDAEYKSLFYGSLVYLFDLGN